MKIEYIETRTGIQTVKINDYFIHSKYNPIEEAKRLAEKIYTPHYAHILFGYGCGYLLDALQDKLQFNEPIFVIDPLFKNSDFVVSEKHHVNHLYNEDSVGKWDAILTKEAPEYRTSFKIYCLSNYDKIFPEIYKELLIDIKGVQYKNRVNDYTLLRYAKDWQNNFTRNLFYLKNDYNLFDLKQKYSAPVVVASGGPSLNKQIPLLKKYRKQFILIASGSTATSLLHEGIEPDYVVSIDGGVPNYSHFKHLTFENAKIMYTMQNHPGVRESFLQEGYLFNLEGFNTVNDYLKTQLKLDCPIVPGGGSVAHSAFSIAQVITSGPIALIGQDLAYTDNLTHAKHNIHARNVDEQFLKQREAFQTEGYDGEPIWTTPVFYSMKLEFEDLLVVNPPRNLFFNCTEGGIKIRNYEQIMFEQFCETYMGEELPEIISLTGPGLYGPVESLIESEILLYKKMIQQLSEGLEALGKNQLTSAFDAKTLKKLDKVDKQIQKAVKKLAIETITVPVTMKVIRCYLPKVNETKQETFERVKKQTEVLYKELKEAIEYCLEEAQKVLQEKQGGE